MCIKKTFGKLVAKPFRKHASEVCVASSIPQSTLE
jgi:hypothetical protein